MESAGKGERLLKVQMGAVMTYCGWGASSSGAGFKEWSSPEAGAVQVRAASLRARSLAPPGAAARFSLLLSRRGVQRRGPRAVTPHCP